MNKLNTKKLQFLKLAMDTFGEGSRITRKDITDLVRENQMTLPYWFLGNLEYKTENTNEYQIPYLEDVGIIPENVESSPKQNVELIGLTSTYSKTIEEIIPKVPKSSPGYVKFGFHNDMVKIFKSKQFFPVFIYGMSGCGKTLMVEQVACQCKREMIRVNISVETDESDLIGGLTLLDGNVIFKEGPVLIAMRHGSVLLLDEIDRGSTKLLCLMGVLEGGSYYVKKTGETIYPKPGFTIVATANTKGQGSDEGRFLAQILDGAFLNRFVIMVEQNFPPPKVEMKIISHIIEEEGFVADLIKWVDVIRQTFANGGIGEIISTRELVHISRVFGIFKNKKKSIEMVINRYDEESKKAMMDLYDVSSVSDTQEENTVNAVIDDDNEIPF